jgi:hypothetical protein
MMAFNDYFVCVCFRQFWGPDGRDLRMFNYLFKLEF